MKSALRRFYPFVGWMKAYRRRDFTADFIAGTVLAIILLPKSIAYASIAGLPPVYGLYAAILSPAVGALWGSSKHLSTGPAAVISFLVFAAVTPLAAGNPDTYLSLAVMLAFIVGGIQLAMGLFRTGAIMNFVSNSVIAGFVNAAAIIIAITQFKDLLGIKVPNSDVFFETLIGMVKALPDANPYAFGVGILSILVITLWKKIHPLFPGGIVAVVVSILAAWKFDLQGVYHVKLVGSIPEGIPFPALPNFPGGFGDVASLIPVAFVISVIGFVEAWSIAKNIAAKTKQKLDVNQELIGQGLSNIVTGFFKWYPVSGSFSGTAVNVSAGGKTPVSNIIASAFIIFSLLFLSGFLEFLPKAVLAAIVIVAVLGLVHVKELFHAYRVNKFDGIAGFGTFAAAFVMKLDYAIFFGIILSLVLFLYRSANPKIVVMEKDLTTDTFKEAESGRTVECPQILFVLPERSLYFGNVETVLNGISAKLASAKLVKFVLLDAESVNYVDITAVEALKTFSEDLKKGGTELKFANLKSSVIKVLREGGFPVPKTIADVFYEGKSESISKIVPQLDPSVCKRCKKRIFKECPGNSKKSW